jgi:hypothetical protein
MNEANLEQMMNFMLEGKKQSFFISIILYLVIFLILSLIIFVIDRFIIKTNNLKIFNICIKSFLLIYIFLIGYQLYVYKHGVKNQGPWYGGIYEAYYECIKCKSLSGGIFGKGPTDRFIFDVKCIHDWQAIYLEDYKEKISDR